MDHQRAQGKVSTPGPSSGRMPGTPASTGQPRKRKNHRAGKKKKGRRKSFALSIDDPGDGNTSEGLSEVRDNFYLHSQNLSNTSIESEALLDHREQPPFLRTRRPSTLTPTGTTLPSPFPAPPGQPVQNKSRLRAVFGGDSDDEDNGDPWGEGAPLLSQSVHHRSEPFGGYGANDASGRRSKKASSRGSSISSNRKKLLNPFAGTGGDGYNVNYPPSIPGTPQMHASDRNNMSFGDLMLRDELQDTQISPGQSINDDERGNRTPAPFQQSPLDRRRTIAQEDVCFPQEGLSELADDDIHPTDTAAFRNRSRRRRGKWPDLDILDEWKRFEEQGRREERRAKKITEPQLINGRLRPVNRRWFRTEEEAPYRFTYFNEEFPSTIHSHTISELVQPGGGFRELFIPDPPIVSDSSDDEDEEGLARSPIFHQVLSNQIDESRTPTRQQSQVSASQKEFDLRRERALSPTNNGKRSDSSSMQVSGTQTPADITSPRIKSPVQTKTAKPIRYGDRPVWWLDILSPTEAEMKVLSKAFGIHPLTAEDIMVQEQREKVELFRNYYFVNYRSFDQDQDSENFLEPVNMYVVVFRECVLSFHFSVTPHSANVRRRIRQLSDYLILSSDWISYAIIDDITDVFVPLIQNIEDEVDDIDDSILQLHSSADPTGKNEKGESGETAAESGRDMLRRVGDCRKKVMLLYRLLGNKADVIKGFAKRCNEHWEVAPRSEIGLYLGDIQDHIVTMTSNLSHYEKILARSHGNYLAQINIRMNERQEQTADVLGKLTVLGTIVLPMNIITGLWGMNVWVPGQEHEGDLMWFMVITAGLLLFGLACYLIAKRVYKIV